MDKLEHYQQQHWRDYTLNLKSDEERQNMEEHLLICDSCLEIYLEELSSRDDYQQDISPEFTDIVIKKAIGSKYENVKKYERNKFFRNYTIAAGLTLALMASGAFDLIGSGMPKIMSSFVYSTKKIETTASNGWSTRLMNSTLDIIDNLNDKLKE